MKLSTLITAFVLGTSAMSTVAVAQPGPDDASWRHRRDYDRDRAYQPSRDYNAGNYGWFPSNFPPFESGWYDDYDRGNYPPGPGFQPQWQPLVQSVSVPAITDRQNIHVGPQLGRFDAIRLDVRHGAMFVYQVAIEFMNGETQVTQVQRWLSRRGDPTAVIDLNGRHRAINRIIVYTAGRGPAAYDLSGV